LIKLGRYIGYEGGTKPLDFGDNPSKVKVTAKGQSFGPIQIDRKNNSKGYKIEMRPVRAMVCMKHSYKPIYEDLKYQIIFDLGGLLEVNSRSSIFNGEYHGKESRYSYGLY